jgi:hypothetical protein
MIHVPPAVAPLVWCLVFVLLVALIYAALKWFDVVLHPKLERLMIGLVGLIVIVVLIFWLLGILGFARPLAAVDMPQFCSLGILEG